MEVATEIFDVPLEMPTTKSEQLLREASHFSPKGVHGNGRWYEPFPLFITKALGARIWDADGNEYIDYHGSYGPAVLGYNDPEVRKVVIETLENEGVLFAAPHPKEVELAKTFNRLIPCAEMTVFCGGGGSDPMYNAVRVSRASTGRKKLLKFEGGYHGWHDYVNVSVRPSAADAGPASDPRAVAGSPGALEEAVRQVVVAPINDLPSLERIVEREKGNLAAAIVEPVCHTCGCLILKDGLLQLLRQLCDAHGIVLIFDEVVTGFRHHLGGAQAIYNVIPDLGVFGKAMGNGYFISALAGKRQIMSQLGPEGPVLFSGTFNGHLLGVTAALKTIELLSDGIIHKRLWRLGNHVSARLNSVIEELDLDARCYNFGSIWCLYFTRHVESYRDIMPMTGYKKAYPKDQAFRRTLLNNGIYIQPGYTNRSFISAAHTDSDIEKTIDVTISFLKENRSSLR